MTSFTAFGYGHGHPPPGTIPQAFRIIHAHHSDIKQAGPLETFFSYSFDVLLLAAVFIRGSGLASRGGGMQL